VREKVCVLQGERESVCVWERERMRERYIERDKTLVPLLCLDHPLAFLSTTRKWIFGRHDISINDISNKDTWSISIYLRTFQQLYFYNSFNERHFDYGTYIKNHIQLNDFLTSNIESNATWLMTFKQMMLLKLF